MKIKTNLGFTLVELLVVIAIIATLVGAVLVSLNSSRAKARDARRVEDMNELQKGLETYLNDCGQYPPTLDTTEATGCTFGTTLGSFIPIIPTNPTPGGITYSYTYDSANDVYTVDFELENGVDVLNSGAHTLQPDGFH